MALPHEESSPYAPIRWRATDWWAFGRKLADSGAVQADGRMARNVPDAIWQGLVMPCMKSAAAQLGGHPERDAVLSQLLGKLSDQRHWSPLVAQYELNGRQIFDFEDHLVDMLDHTDLGNATLGSLKLPYDCFFLRFGRQERIKSEWNEDFEYVDGAFIAATPWDDQAPIQHRLKIGLATIKRDGSGVMMPGYFLDITPTEAALPAAEAVDAAIARRRATFMADAKGDAHSEAFAQLRIHEADEGARLARLALPLIINGLYYLESLNDLPAEEPGRDTSSELTARWAQEAPAKRSKLRSQLTASGYTVVKIVGRELGRPQVGGSERNGPRTHWRRGFTREQRYGAGLAFCRRVWIKPTLVNASDAGEDLPGHIYVAGPSTPQ